jgi:quercetin dioxygenase-like cupin family protein
MAIISLGPDESFEHYHNAPSKTVHLEGDIEFEVAGLRRRMQGGETIEVAANTPHIIINVGSGAARINCVGTGGGSHGPAQIRNPQINNNRKEQ